MTEIETKIFVRFPDSTIVYPGNGKPTTLGVERPDLGGRAVVAGLGPAGP